ncbi:hypothetical protein ACIOD2_27185 [Amycolatopsis sp. NPDC088138]|uniref:hypothetical protein n=1 Tax=Amycolatopsis sp. NPDC088138 TaxID=3363938 RepID=UPI003812CBF5
MVWWLIRFTISVPSMPSNVGPFSNKELAQLFINRHCVEADYEILPIVPPTELRDDHE